MPHDFEDAPFTIAVYDKTLRRVGWVGDPVSLTVTPRHNRQPTAALTVRADHGRLPDLAAKGARLVLSYDGSQIMSGRVRLRQGKGPASQGEVTFQVVDDWRLFTRVRARPIPAGGLAQGTTETYDVRTGTAEAVVRQLVQAHPITRLGMPVTLGPDGGRGGQVRVQAQWETLADLLFPAVDQAGIGVAVRQVGTEQQGTGLRVDCYAPATYPLDLTEESGIVQEWGWSQADPDLTRITGAATGDGTAVSYRELIDAAREADWDDLIEGHRDSTGARTSDPTWQADLDAELLEALTEAAPRAGLSVKLAETSTFRYDPTGQAGVRVGDRVRIAVGPGVVVDDVLREATLTWSAEDGFDVTPTVGERADSTTTLARAVARIARAAFRRPRP